MCPKTVNTHHETTFYFPDYPPCLDQIGQAAQVQWDMESDLKEANLHKDLLSVEKDLLDLTSSKAATGVFYMCKLKTRHNVEVVRYFEGGVFVNFMATTTELFFDLNSTAVINFFRVYTSLDIDLRQTFLKDRAVSITSKRPRLSANTAGPCEC